MLVGDVGPSHILNPQPVVAYFVPAAMYAVTQVMTNRMPEVMIPSIVQ
jgi:hypothetical protein